MVELYPFPSFPFFFPTVTPPLFPFPPFPFRLPHPNVFVHILLKIRPLATIVMSFQMYILILTNFVNPRYLATVKGGYEGTLFIVPWTCSRTTDNMT